MAKRKEESADTYPGVDEDDEDAWGVDELDELEEDSDEEDEGDVDEDEEGEKLVKDDEEAESEPVAQRKDGDVDAPAVVQHMYGWLEMSREREA